VGGRQISRVLKKLCETFHRLRSGQQHLFGFVTAHLRDTKKQPQKTKIRISCGEGNLYPKAEWTARQLLEGIASGATLRVTCWRDARRAYGRSSGLDGEMIGHSVSPAAARCTWPKVPLLTAGEAPSVANCLDHVSVCHDRVARILKINFE